MKFKARKVKPNLAKAGGELDGYCDETFFIPPNVKAPKSGNNEDLFQLDRSHVWQKQLQVALV